MKLQLDSFCRCGHVLRSHIDFSVPIVELKCDKCECLNFNTSFHDTISIECTCGTIFKYNHGDTKTGGSLAEKFMEEHSGCYGI